MDLYPFNYHVSAPWGGETFVHFTRVRIDQPSPNNMEETVLIYDVSGKPMRQPLVFATQYISISAYVDKPYMFSMRISPMDPVMMVTQGGPGVPHSVRMGHFKYSITPSGSANINAWVREVCPKCDQPVDKLVDYLCEECRFG